ncbi:MAG: TIGR00725 family protein, partial [Actinomycetota bacterium]|nr:TIGR00725 family protein [Actinomycetota bacterium]
AIGILPDEDRGRANGYLSYTIATGVGQARNLAVACSGDVVVAVGGGYGTLSEVGLALKVGRPVVALGGWELGDHVVVAGSPAGAVEAAFGLLGV